MSSSLELSQEEDVKLKSQNSSREAAISKLQSTVKCALAEKSEVETKICQLQSLWETEKAKEAEKLSDLEKARDLLLNSKVDLQGKLDECQADLRRLQQNNKDEKAQNQKLMSTHSKTLSELKARHVRKISYFHHIRDLFFCNFDDRAKIYIFATFKVRNFKNRYLQR